jgi:hypothetical protein
MKTTFAKRYSVPVTLCALLGGAGLATTHSASPLDAQSAAKNRPDGGKSTTSRPTPSTPPPLLFDAARLPEKTAAMRDAIAAAARSGSIEALRTPLEWNELKPDISSTSANDPIAYWKAQSGDGEGRQILALLLEILESPPAVVAAGTSAERYVWPGFAEIDLATLTPPLEVQLYRLVSPDHVKAMREGKRWTWWRLSIGADGTWHSFVKGE